MNDLESLERVREQLLSRLRPTDAVRRPLEQAHGRVLRSDVTARDALPPFDASAMDGFAFRAEDTRSATADSAVTLRVVGTAAAGDPDPPQPGPGEAVKIFTGALVPASTDTVAPWEETASHDDSQVTFAAPVERGRFVRPRGGDVEPGSAVMSAGAMLTPGRVALLASLGHAEVPVGRELRVAVHSSGDELVPLEESVGPGRIRNSNGYSIAARVEQFGARALRRPVIRDELDVCRTELRRTLSLRPDVIVTTGGVSAGERDHLRDVARELGDDVSVRRVDLKPGKPLVDGTIGGVPYFGLPGNPVACLVSFELFVRPALAKLEGRTEFVPPRLHGIVREAATLRPIRRRRFLHARATMGRDGYELVIPSEQESHQIASFSGSNALIDVTAGGASPTVGERVEFVSLEAGTGSS